MNEDILEAWLKLNGVINNGKLVSELPYNETLIYRYLYQHQDEVITATKLCEVTGMLKSQMNRTLTSMENKQLIFRNRSKNDKRQIEVSINVENVSFYETQHKRILHIVDRLIERIGEYNAKTALILFDMIAKIAKEELV